MTADVTVIGAGPSGCRAANEAAAQGESVVVAMRGMAPGRFARMLGGSASALDPRIEILFGMEAFGLYRGGTLVACAPHAHDKGGVVIETGRTVIATGRRSCPPLVPGNNLPGVLDAHAALELAAAYGVAPGMAVAVIGTGAESGIADRLRALGVNVVATLSVTSVRKFTGRRHVTGVEGERTIECDCVIHAGPWRRDLNLLAQIQVPDPSRPAAPPDSPRVTYVGLGDEPVVVGSGCDETTMICPCMDVSWGEIAHRFDAKETNAEVLKRLTACGMGPCQGTPCWDLMAAEIVYLTGSPAAVDLPTQRDPRRALTVAQAAGMDGLVEPDR
jgi:glycine/D-amino acid oxidase-like deaminating enzyme